MASREQHAFFSGNYSPAPLCPEGLSGDIYAHHSEFSSKTDGDNKGGTAGH